jgi:hypothetical protein
MRSGDTVVISNTAVAMAIPRHAGQKRGTNHAQTLARFLAAPGIPSVRPPHPPKGLS